MQHLIRNLHFLEFVLLDLELFDEVKHTPSMRVLDVHPLQYLFKENVSQLISTLVIIRLEDDLDNKVNKVSCYNVWIANEIQSELDEFIAKFIIKIGNEFLK